MIDALERIGLSRQEAEIYITVLTLGSAKASTIARKARVSREAVYYTLKLLVEKGFVSEFIKSGVKHYSAIKPKEILDILDEENRKKKDAIRSIIPKLNAMRSAALEQPKVEFYEGKEGFKSVALLLIEKENTTIYGYVPESIMRFVPEFHRLFRLKRIRRNIKIHVITERTELMEGFKKYDKKELRKMRFHKIMNGLDTAFYIIPGGVIILKANKNEMLGIYIEDKSLSKLHKRIFLEMWKDCES